MPDSSKSRHADQPCLGEGPSLLPNGQGTRAYAYDAATLALTNEMLVSGGVTNALARSYDGLGRSAGIALDGDYAAAYAYDAVGRFASVAWALPGNAATATYAYAANSDAIAGYDLARGANTYSTRRPLESQRDLVAGVSNLWNGAPVSSFHYVNDELARRVRRVDNAAVTNDFGYNLRSELTAANMGTNAYGYAYDPIGNRLVATNNAEAFAYAANALNQYTNITHQPSTISHPTYDADGNMLFLPSTSGGGAGGEGWYLQWNGENRLIGASNGATVVTFAYDYMGRRFEKVAGAVTNRFLYDGWAMIREQSSAGTTNTYVYGLDLSGSLQGAGTIGGILSADLGITPVFYAYDANGNVTDLVDENGSNVAHYVYDPFGNISFQTGPESASNPFRFSSKYADEETGLVYYGYRYFVPTLGRWISRDPLEEEGGIGLYVFTGNAAVSLWDFVGLCDIQVKKLLQAWEHIETEFRIDDSTLSGASYWVVLSDNNVNLVYEARGYVRCCTVCPDPPIKVTFRYEAKGNILDMPNPWQVGKGFPVNGSSAITITLKALRQLLTKTGLAALKGIGKQLTQQIELHMPAPNTIPEGADIVGGCPCDSQSNGAK